MSSSKENLQVQKWVVGVSVSLFVMKLAAWYITGSVAIMTDALESVVNVISGIIGLYSLYLASLPRDKNHPYGHGKVEFLSAATEGILITVAGLIIIFESVNKLRFPGRIDSLDYGILLTAGAGIINFIAGWYAHSKGIRNNSLALQASGRHLQSDAWSTLGILVGLALLYFTGWQWLDSITALIFAVVIIITGVQIVGKSISGIMDEADEALLTKLLEVINKNRNPHWIDLHNLRIIRYGSTLHVDCHLTVPWYFDVRQAHEEVDKLEKLAKQRFGDLMELFVHTDACEDFSCRLCTKEDCPVRKFPFEKIQVWTIDNIAENKRHQLDEH